MAVVIYAREKPWYISQSVFAPPFATQTPLSLASEDSGEPTKQETLCEADCTHITPLLPLVLQQPAWYARLRSESIIVKQSPKFVYLTFFLHFRNLVHGDGSLRVSYVYWFVRCCHTVFDFNEHLNPRRGWTKLRNSASHNMNSSGMISRVAASVRRNGRAGPAFPKLVGREPICGGSRKVFEMWFF
jgi:hypothetical protein